MNNFHFIFIFFISLLLMSSCGDDEQQQGATDQFNYLDNTYKLTNGYLQTYGVNDDGSYDWDLNLIGGTLTVNSEGLGEEGEGPEVYFDLNSSSELGLLEGVYSYSDGARMAFNFVDSTIESEILDVEIMEGTIEIFDANINSLSLSFDLKDENGNSISGIYSNSVILIE